MDKTMGTCSKCGGRVVIPEAWMGVKPPVLRCENCGATKTQPYGPVIDMDGGNKDNRGANDEGRLLTKK